MFALGPNNTDQCDKINENKYPNLSAGQLLYFRSFFFLTRRLAISYIEVKKKKKKRIQLEKVSN